MSVTSDSRIVVSALRSAIGVGGWLAPIAAGRLFGIDARKDVSAALYLRMGATRDFALAAGPFVTTGKSRKRMLMIGAACDIGDIVAVLIAHRGGKISRTGTGAFVAASLACLAFSAKAHAEVDD